MPVAADHKDPEFKRTTALRESVAEVAPKVGGLSQSFSELCHQGIEVDNDNKRAPENNQSSAPATQTI